MVNQKNQDSLARASKSLMLSKPYYGIFLIMLNKQWSKIKVPTAGVALQGINYNLYINEDFWWELTEIQQRSLLWHEMLHLVFFHLTDWDHLSDHKIANIAKDICINQYIPLNELPPHPCLPTSFPELNLLPNEGTQYYYDELTKAKKEETSPSLDACLNAMGPTGVSICEMPDGSKVSLDTHDIWGDCENMDEATKKLVKRQMTHILNEVAEQVKKSRGIIPGEVETLLSRLNYQEPPKFDWKGYLRRFAGKSVKIYTKKSRRKSSKRFEDSPGLKIKKKKHILVGVDTSGSVSISELKEFFQEIYHIFKGGTDITVLQCDSGISNISVYKKNMEEGIKIYGRGGTSFDPYVTYANENQRKYSALIVFSDGEAPAPEDKCALRTLWVHSSKSEINEELQGYKIKLN